MDLKLVSMINGHNSPTVGKKYKSRYLLGSIHWDISIDGINFSSWHMKGYFVLAPFCQKITLWLIINYLVWACSRNFKPIGRYENAKTRFLTKNEVFNQLVECSNSELTCINYHLKWRFHTVQANIHRFSDWNYLFGAIVIFPDRWFKLVVDA